MMIFAPGHVKGGEPRLVLNIRIGPVGQQVLDTPLQARLGGVVQRTAAGIIPGIDVDPFTLATR